MRRADYNCRPATELEDSISTVGFVPAQVSFRRDCSRWITRSIWLAIANSTDADKTAAELLRIVF